MGYKVFSLEKLVFEVDLGALYINNTIKEDEDEE